MKQVEARKRNDERIRGKKMKDEVNYADKDLIRMHAKLRTYENCLKRENFEMTRG